MYGVICQYRDKKVTGSRTALYLQSGLILWSVVNYSIINAFGPSLSLAMVIVQIFYPLIMVWFFTTITLKTIEASQYWMIYHPFVMVFEAILAIILLLIFPFVILWFSATLWCSESIPGRIEVPRKRNNYAFQHINKDIHKICWAIWLDPVFEDQKTQAALPWGHLFHMDCINRFLGKKAQFRCPIDKKITSRDQVLKVTF